MRRSSTKRFAAATVVKNAGSVAARVLSVAAVNAVCMLSEASIISAMRRPGYDTVSLTSAV